MNRENGDENATGVREERGKRARDAVLRPSRDHHNDGRAPLRPSRAVTPPLVTERNRPVGKRLQSVMKAIVVAMIIRGSRGRKRGKDACVSTG